MIRLSAGKIGAILAGVLTVLPSIAIAAEPSSPIWEVTGGESIYTQSNWYYFGEVGVFVPLFGKDGLITAASNPEVATASTGTPTLHVFLGVNDLVYITADAISPTDTQTYEGLEPAVGVRWPLPGGYIEGDIGAALANFYEQKTPIQGLVGIYLQGEIYQLVGPGAVDLFANYTGYNAYWYFQARYLIPAYASREWTLYAGPEDIGETAIGYWAGLGGAVLGFDVPPIHSYLTLDFGLLRSSAGNGPGGYEGFSWYVSF
jgi:hypothetical protein